METQQRQQSDTIKDLFSVGAHFGYSKAKRHPSMQQFIYGTTHDHEIIDLTATTERLRQATDVLADLIKNGKTVLFVGGKKEAQEAVRTTAEALSMPYVAGRWIGGTITNFKEIRRRVDKLQNLRTQREKGELAKYTKYEQLSFDREIEDLARYYEGLIPLTDLPDAVVVIDPEQERIAAHEASLKNIPVVAIANSDCNIRTVDYPIPANDTLKSSIDHLCGMIRDQLAAVAAQEETTSRTEPSNNGGSNSSSQE